jgi:hypothetical protein
MSGKNVGLSMEKHVIFNFGGGGGGAKNLLIC